jgi:hypothetical protein
VDPASTAISGKGAGQGATFTIHLAKPIDPAELVTTIAALVKRFPSDAFEDASDRRQQ